MPVCHGNCFKDFSSKCRSNVLVMGSTRQTYQLNRNRFLSFLCYRYRREVAPAIFKGPQKKGVLKKTTDSRTYCIISVGLLVLILIATGIVYLTSSASTDVRKGKPPDPEEPLPPSSSVLRQFTKGAVCSDGAPCSEIGRDILKKNGSAVDAAIATLFCNGVVTCQSMGLGGGFLMTIYERQTKTAYSLNAREMAPRAVTEEMYKYDPNLTKQGPLAVGVPGELAGYWAAHKRFGRLSWGEVVEPSIKICEYGYNMTKHQFDSLNFRSETIYKDEILRELFVNASTGKFYPQGTRIVQNQMCKTLKIIAEFGGDVLYNGSLAKVFVNDIREMGGVITLEDMENYRVQWSKPIRMDLTDGLTLLSSPPPGSGALLALILNILEGFNFNKDSISTVENTVLTYHRIIEAFKFAFAKRAELGDPRFFDVTEVVTNSTLKSYGDFLRSRINDNLTYNNPESYGAVFKSQDDHGTAHVSVLSPDGDAVSVTSTINLYFGAGITSKNTGIILNSGMDDFSSKYIKNYFELPVSVANSIKPGKQPLSSMCPSILVDSKGDVRMVVGAAGGTKITTGVAYVIMRHLWFGEDVKTAVDASRIHHQLVPKKLLYEYGVIKPILKGLTGLGHEVIRAKNRLSVVCAIVKHNDTVLANADYRKGGDVHGF